MRFFRAGIVYYDDKKGKIRHMFYRSLWLLADGHALIELSRTHRLPIRSYEAFLITPRDMQVRLTRRRNLERALKNMHKAHVSSFKFVNWLHLATRVPIHLSGNILSILPEIVVTKTDLVVVIRENHVRCFRTTFEHAFDRPIVYLLYL